MEKGDIAKEFLEKAPGQRKSSEKAEYDMAEDDETNSKNTEIVEEETKSRLKRQKKSPDEVISIKITNGFSLGLKAAVAFWLITLIICAIIYGILTYLGYF